jgi:HSP20 family protein
MYLATYEPWKLLDQFRRDIDQVFGHSPEQSVAGDSAIATSAWVPTVDIQETPQQFVLEADIPGVDPKDIDIAMENGVLTLKGERHSDRQKEEKNYKHVERVHGTFYRRFSLPDTADPEKVTASGKNGVLQITIPKRQVALSRKITVEA